MVHAAVILTMMYTYSAFTLFHMQQF